MKNICVDLDNTLVYVDTMFVLWLQTLQKNPLHACYALFIFIFRGSAEAKHFLVCDANIAIKNLPYNQGLISWIKKQRAAGHAIWLVTGTNQFVANRIAMHLAIFDGVYASDKHNNLVGKKKATFLKNQFENYTYIGDNKKDIPVWAGASECGLVGDKHTKRFKDITFKYVFNRPKPTFKDWAKLFRAKDWFKNLLIFLPVLLYHPYLDLTLLNTALITFVCLCLFASFGYVINDAIDFSNDIDSSRHQTRPFVKGLIDIPHALTLATAPLFGGLLLTLTLPLATTWCLITYILITLIYSLIAKRYAILDLFVLSSLYALRVDIGCTLTTHICTSEISLAILFICLGLVCAKRYCDLQHNTPSSTSYRLTDTPFFAQMGMVASGLGTMLFSDYIRSFSTLNNGYQHPNNLFLFIPILLYWQFKVWYDAHNYKHINQLVDYVRTTRLTYIVLSLFVIIVLASK